MLLQKSDIAMNSPSHLLLFLFALAYVSRISSTTEDVKHALTWARELLGLAGILAGFLGVSTATLKTNLPQTQAIYAAGGLAGILAGATLLNAES